MIIRKAIRGYYDRPRQQVTIENLSIGTVVDEYVTVLSVTQNHGAGGSQASFAVDRMRFDSNRSLYRNAHITVAHESALDGTYSIIFQGFVVSDSASLTSNREEYTFEARSVVSLLDKVKVGTADKVPKYVFWRRDPHTGLRTNWTPRRVLQNLWGKLPSGWAAYVGLGDLSALTTTYGELPVDWEFTDESYLSALTKVLSVYGDVSFRERWNGQGAPRVSLDFFRVAERNAVQRIVVGASGQSCMDAGSFVMEVTEQCTLSQSTNRVITYGAPVQCMITVTNFYGLTIYGDGTTYQAQIDDTRFGTAAELLVAGWDNTAITIQVPQPDGTKIPRTATPEALVLEEPERAKPGSPFFVPQCQNVFRRWVLPSCLWPLAKQKSNCLKRLYPDRAGEKWNEAAYPMQVWKVPYRLDPNPNTTRDTYGVEVADTYRRVDSVKYDLETNSFTTAEPVLNIEETWVTDQDVTRFRRVPAKLGLVLSVGFDALYYDTGQPSAFDLKLPVIGIDGLAESFHREELEYNQFNMVGTGPNGEALRAVDSAGAWRTYERCVYWDEDLRQFRVVTGQEVMQNDRTYLKSIADEILRQKNRVHRNYMIRVGIPMTSARIGDTLELAGVGSVGTSDCAVTSIEWDLIGQDVVLTADNIRPPRKIKERRQGVRGTIANAEYYRRLRDYGRQVRV